MDAEVPVMVDIVRGNEMRCSYRQKMATTISIKIRTFLRAVQFLDGGSVELDSHSHARSGMKNWMYV